MIKGNIANAETPGYRAMGYDFEDQLQAVAPNSDTPQMKATHPKHLRNTHTFADGTLKPDLYIRPNESVSHDGNTVDVDQEMASMQENQILYRSAIELLNRKVGILRYAITGGR